MGCIHSSKTVIAENPNRFEVTYADQTVYINAELEINGKNFAIVDSSKYPTMVH